ncbi:MAG: hypothetical protein RLZZ352_2278 [Pseudomonadota bacterium]|jgi:DNA polymerase-3 subunit chi
MTEVAFHFNVPDRQAYALRLLRKAYLRQARLLVRLPAQLLVALDAALWTQDKESFIAHAREEDPPHVRRHSPILLCSEVPVAVAESPEASALVLVNLCDSMPPHWARFARVIEVVTLDEADRLQARQRWREYTRQGIQPVRHDLKLEPAT